MNRRWTPVVNELKRIFPTDTERGVIDAYLEAQGYDVKQISEILALLYEDGSSSLFYNSDNVKEHPIRVQGPHERGRFQPEAWGFLIGLLSSGAISLHDFEHLVERAFVHMDGRISISDVHMLLEEHGVDASGYGPDRSQVH